MSNKRLELTWYNKDMALIPTEAGRYGYKWVDPSDPRYCETHTLIYDEYIQGEQSSKSDKYQYSPISDYEPQTKNLMILGESGDVLETITRVPELAKEYLGQVKLVYIANFSGYKYCNRSHQTSGCCCSQYQIRKAC